MFAGKDRNNCNKEVLFMYSKLFLLVSFILMLALPVTVQANLFQNGGFEANGGAGEAADYWARSEEAGVELWSSHSGSWGMAFVTWIGDGNGYFYQDVSVAGGRSCTYTIWASRDAGTLTGAYYMKIEWYDGESYISQDSQLIIMTPSVWEQKTLSVTSPSNANIARVMISASNVDVVGKFDDANFVVTGAPTGVVATGHDSRIDLRWGSLSDTVLQNYNIYRSTSETGTYTKLNSSGHATVAYSDFFGANGQTYYYYVTAVTSSGESSASSIVSASSYAMTDNQLLTSVQEATFRYFWDFGHPVSGLAREGLMHLRDTCAIGGTGMGLMAICVGADRGFVTRAEAAARVLKILTFLDEETTRYHGAWPHQVNGTSGATIPFSPPIEDDGGDLVETGFLVQGMLTAREYFDSADSVETQIRSKVTSLWEGVEWDWYLRRSDTGYESNEVLYWHWSPNYGWDMDMPIYGYNECMVTYLLAVASPTNPIPASCYYNGWAGGTYGNTGTYYGYRQWVGSENGPLFFVHYSYLGFDPRGKSDGYCNYYYNSRNNTLVNRAHCDANPGSYTGYSDLVWGLTASVNPWGYSAHSPSNDNGTIAPTAAISSMPYTPDESIATLKHLYNTYGDDGLWGPYGFVDAFNLTESWYADTHLAIDQGPIVVMIENYRTRLCWDLFMSNSEIDSALASIGWTILDPEKFVLASYESSETGLTVTSPDSGITTLASVAGDTGGAPAATEGSNVLKVTWTGETDNKIEIKHEWSNLTFDLAGYDEILADIYIASSSALPGTVGIWDDVFGWNEASSVPTVINEWFTASFDISSNENVCLDHASAFIFENMAGDDGTIYIDNIRIVGPHVVTFGLSYSEKEESNYSGAACLKMSLDYQGSNSYTQSSLHSYGVANNSTENQSSDHIDPQGMYLAMNNYELNANYNYSALERTTLNDSYHDICYWIGYCVPSADPENLPAMIPTGGDYENWVVVNGFSASDDPWSASSYTVNGFWITDPSASGIGENIYKTAMELGSSFTALSTSDTWDGKYVAICEPPEHSAKVFIAKPAKYKDKLGSKRDVIDAAIKGLKDNVLRIDGELEVAYIGSKPGKPMLVRNAGGDYFIVPFVKNGGCSVAVIVDALDGTFKEASYCDVPDVKYLKRFGKKARKGNSSKSKNAFLPGRGNVEVSAD
jgi:hypothetical protein